MIGRRGFITASGALLTGGALARAAEADKPRVAINTALGTFTVELEARRAPITCANFLRYVDHGRYRNGEFFRTVRTPGAPGEGQIVASQNPHEHPYPPIAHESTAKTGLRHLEGTISLGRFEVGSATSNFFVCTSAEPYLDAHPEAKGDNQGYAAFGQVVSGMAIVRRIHAEPTQDNPNFPTQRGQWLRHPVAIIGMRRV